MYRFFSNIFFETAVLLIFALFHVLYAFVLFLRFQHAVARVAQLSRTISITLHGYIHYQMYFCALHYIHFAAKLLKGIIVLKKHNFFSDGFICCESLMSTNIALVKHISSDIIIRGFLV